MTRHSTLLLATLLLGVTACDKADAPDPSKQAKAEAPEPATPAQPEAQPEAPEPATEAATVASGLALDMRFAAFQIINAETGREYCQVCEYGPSPKIIAVGTIDDEGFKQDLKQLDALVDKYGDKVKAFAVIAEPRDGALVTPVATKDELLAKAKQLKQDLELSFPVVIPAPNGDQPNKTFEDHYQVKLSRTIMVSDRENKVKYNAVAPADNAGLDAAIQAVVG